MSTVQPSPSPVMQQAGSGELDEVMQVMQVAFDPRFGEAWTRAQCAGILPMSGVRLVLARTDGRPAGFSLTRRVADEAELLLLAVSPELRAQGIGGALLRDFTDRSRETGLRRLHLEVRAGNKAVSLYSRYQFVVEGRRPKYYRGTDGEFHDALTMARTLTPK